MLASGSKALGTAVKSRHDPGEPGRRIRIDPVSAKATEVDGPTAPGSAKSNIATIWKRTDRYNGDVWGKPRDERNILVRDPAWKLDDFAITHAVHSSSDGSSTRLAGEPSLIARAEFARTYKPVRSRANNAEKQT